MLAGLGWKIAAEVVASVFGTMWAQYRPGTAPSPATLALLPLQSGNLIAAALPGYVTPNAYQKTPMPLDPAKPRVHAVFDPAALAPGDYVVGSLEQGGASETFYIATIESPAPPAAVRCNAVVNVTRSVRTTVFGPQAALDTQPGNEITLLQGWPASILPTGRSATGDVRLPDDVNLGAYTVLLPSNIPVTLRSGDAITNTSAPEAIRAIVAAADMTDDGWRLLVQQASA